MRPPPSNLVMNTIRPEPKLKITLVLAMLLMAGLTLPVAGAERDKQDVVQLHATLELKDGSRLVGVPLEKTLPVTLDFMKASIMPQPGLCRIAAKRKNLWGGRNEFSHAENRRRWRSLERENKAKDSAYLTANTKNCAWSAIYLNGLTWNPSERGAHCGNEK